VQAPDGSEAYTRAGDLRIDTSGLLLTGSGLPVMGNGAPISLPPAQSVNIGIDGTVSVRPLGASAQEIAEVDRIKLVKPEPRQLFKGEDGLMHSRDGAPILADANVRLESGFLESSNVNAISALTDLISLSRQFEMQIKLMKTAERNAQASAQLLQFS
jgi:flagellar basal-body rod protein FlgF